MMRYKNESVASWLTWDILKLKRGTTFGRYTHLFLAFVHSGLCYVLMDIVGPIPLSECEALGFFITHALVFILEDAIAATYRKIKGTKRTDEEPPVWIKLIGALWVCAVIIWVSPKWIYPGLRHAIAGRKAELLPFSIAQAFL